MDPNTDKTTVELVHEATLIKNGATSAITTADEARDAAAKMLEIKRLGKRADAFFDPMLKTARAAWQSVIDSKKRITEPLAEAEKALKDGLVAYNDRERRRLEAEAEERRRLQEAQAAEDRRIQAEEIAAAAKRQADAAVASAAALEAAGETAAAGYALEQATAIEETAKANVAVAAAQPLALAPIAPSAPPKLEGVSFRTTYDAEVVDLIALCRAIGNGTVTSKLVVPDTKVLRQLATAMKDEFSFPGCRLLKNTAAAGKV